MALERRANWLAALGIPKPQRLAVVELQYRGTMWTQLNGKDWKVEAFLVSENGGLGLEVGRDNATRNATLGALDVLATHRSRRCADTNSRRKTLIG